MAYSSAIFYVDLFNGSNATRATLTNVTVSNPSGSIVRAHYVGHGLVTGAVVTLSLFTSYLNGTWKITKVDDNNFDIDDAVWATTSDYTGNCVPFGGSSWEDAWLTPSKASVTGPYDEVRIAKTPDPVSIGNAIWTKLNKEVILSSPRTTTIELGDAAWTPVANVTAGINTSYKKYGTCSTYLSITTNFTTGKAGYKTLEQELDLSAYQEISFWLRPSAPIYEGRLKVCLCSDTTGDTIIDEFYIPIQNQTNRFRPVTIKKEGGGNLGSSIKSIAIYAAVDPGAIYLYMNDFIATKTGDLNLSTLITPNGLASGGDFGSYPIQSINGTSVILDKNNDNYSNQTSVFNWGFGGETNIYETFIRTPIAYPQIQLSSSSTQVLTFSPGSFDFNKKKYRFGFNTVTNEQDGQTYLDGQNGNGYGVYMTSKISIERLSVVRYSYGYHLNALNNSEIREVQSCNGNSTGLYIGNNSEIVDLYDIVSISCNSTGLYFSSADAIRSNLIKEITANSNGASISDGASISLLIGSLNCDTMGITADGTPPCSSSYFEINESYDCQHNFNISGTFIKIKAGVVVNRGTGFCLNLDGGATENILIADSLDANGGKIATCLSGVNYIICPSLIGAHFSAPSNADKWFHNQTWFSGYDNDVDSKKCHFWGGLAEWDKTVAYDLGPGSWRLSTIYGYTRYYSINPMQMKLANIAVGAGRLVTIKIYGKRVTITAGLPKGRFEIAENPLSGIEKTSIDFTEINGEWVEHTITFTPTNKGVAELLVFFAEGGLDENSFYIGKIEVTQAD